MGLYPPEGIRRSNCQADIDKRVEEIFEQVCRERDSILEEVEMGEGYVALRTLIPKTVAVAEVVEEGIGRYNRDQEGLGPSSYVTNTEIPDREDLLKYLADVRDMG